MAERDLDQYLEGLGIDVDEEEAREDATLVTEDGGEFADDEQAGDELADDVLADDEQYRDDYDEPFDMEAALDGTAAYAFGVVPHDLGAAERTESFLVNLLLQLDPTYSVEVSDRGDEIHAEVFGGDYGRIIGKGGRTLAALEFLTNAVVNRTTENGVRVIIDVGGYKRRRDERLRQTAMKASARVRKSGESVELEPMSAAERRVIHMAVADDPNVTSESTGEGRARRVVIKPVG
jgi:spoIIIJ-associated protein